MSALVECICHREQLSIWAGELSAALALSDFLKEDWSFDDSVDLEKEIVAQLGDIIGSAFTHPEVNVTALLSELLEALKMADETFRDLGWHAKFEVTSAAIANAEGLS